jgi:hypothetical protein
MSHRIACYTLFDITQTGVLNRAKPNVDTKDIELWVHQRNTQCNFDTILQIISLRGQPDILSNPKKIDVCFDKNSNFGYLYQDGKMYSVWTFEFEVQHSSVFEDGIEEMGFLYKDCQGVPMIKCGTEYNKLDSFLDVQNPTKNIYFVKY